MLFSVTLCERVGESVKTLFTESVRNDPRLRNFFSPKKFADGSFSPKTPFFNGFWVYGVGGTPYPPPPICRQK